VWQGFLRSLRWIPDAFVADEIVVGIKAASFANS
jgi:hypothetical protein